MELEEMRASPPPSTSNGAAIAIATATASRGSIISRLKKDCLFFTVSLQEGFRNIKAFFVGQAKKLTARNEREATEAELQTEKMQVEAADAAEYAKKRLNKSV